MLSHNCFKFFDICSRRDWSNSESLFRGILALLSLGVFYIITNKTVKNKVYILLKTKKIVIYIDKTNKLVYYESNKEVMEMVKFTLEAARTNIGYTQKEAAALFGMHYQTLAKLEEDSTNAPYSFIQAIPSVYKVPSDYIFFGCKNEFIRLLREG